MNPFTIEEARTLESFYNHQSISKTAIAMKKANSAIVYALDSIEQKSGFKLFDRSGYRTEFLPAGERVLEGCRQLLAAADDLKRLCDELAHGWESDLRIIVEGVVPLEPIFKGMKSIADQDCPTRFHVQAEFMTDVEETYLKTGANLMISVLPPEKVALVSEPLFQVPAYLVAEAGHPVFREKKVTAKILSSHSILTVRGSSPKPNMSTAIIEADSRIQFNDFNSKKIAVMGGLGFGWLPEYLIRDELKAGQLRVIKWEKSSHHVFHPHLYHRGENRLGRTARQLIGFLAKIKKC